MRFIDEAEITAEGGKGGNGCVHFRREKYIPKGGPDGGDGGRGGNVVLEGSSKIRTLYEIKLNRHLKAENGKDGGPNQRTGRSGRDLIVKVPLGTEVYLKDAPELLVADIVEEGQRVVIAKGGRGGHGNAYFKSSTNRAPRYAQEGEKGEKESFILSLKLLADVGIIGEPNAGKSTLISRISNARPKIADYPFTTLTPNVGITTLYDYTTVTVADIPGLIPEASKGKGLGIQFLKHISRTKVLIHLIDLFANQDLDKLENSYRLIRDELKGFSKELIEKPEIVVLSKIDLLRGEEGLVVNAVERLQKAAGKKVLALSSVTGEGIKELKAELAKFFLKNVAEAANSC
ncbi:MAG: GTPase ObgE [Candidatus Dadabacteria bacterium]|nr:MAG: GTPase ObgE [Candidatus Dadabacteria bacterium]